MITLWDARSGRELRKFQAEGGAIEGLVFWPDGSRLAAYGADGPRKPREMEQNLITLWDINTGTALLRIAASSRVHDVAVSPNNRHVAMAYFNGEIQLWDVDAKQMLRSWKSITGICCNVTFSPDGRRLAADGSTAKRKEGALVQVWDVDTGEEIFKLKSLRGLVLCVAFSPDGSRLATTDKDGRVKVWDANNGDELLSPLTTLWEPHALSFSADGYRLIAANHGAVEVYDARPLAPRPSQDQVGETPPSKPVK
jgi:WD40 repeat protein